MALSQLMESKCDLHFGCRYFLTPRHSHMVATWGTKTTALSEGKEAGLGSSVASEESMHFGKCCHRGLWAPAVFGKVDFSGKSKGDIFNRRLIFFHLYGKCLIPKAVLKAKHSR